MKTTGYLILNIDHSSGTVIREVSVILTDDKVNIYDTYHDKNVKMSVVIESINEMISEYFEDCSGIVIVSPSIADLVKISGFKYYEFKSVTDNDILFQYYHLNDEKIFTESAYVRSNKMLDVLSGFYNEI